MVSYTRTNAMKCLNCVLTHLHTYPHSCNRLLSFSATIITNSLNRVNSHWLFGKRKIMYFEKRIDKWSLSAKPSQNYARKKEDMAFPSLPFLSIFIYRHRRFARLYKLVHNVKIKVVYFCGFEMIICILLMGGDK